MSVTTKTVPTLEEIENRHKENLENIKTAYLEAIEKEKADYYAALSQIPTTYRVTVVPACNGRFNIRASNQLGKPVVMGSTDTDVAIILEDFPAYMSEEDETKLYAQIEKSIEEKRSFLLEQAQIESVVNAA